MTFFILQPLSFSLSRYTASFAQFAYCNPIGAHPSGASRHVYQKRPGCLPFSASFEVFARHMPTLETEQIELSPSSAPEDSPQTPRKRAPRKRKSAAKTETSAIEAVAEAVAVAEVAPTPEPEVAVEPESENEEEFSPALLFLEDFVVTSLLSAGHALTSEKLAERAEGWSLPLPALGQALTQSKRVRFDDGAWNLIWHSERRNQSREDRARAPIESLIRELLLAVGKPLPIPVIAREVGLMLHSHDPNLKNTVAGIIKTLRWAIAIAPGIYLHENWMLRTGAPDDELLIRENRLSRDPDFQGLREFAEISATEPGAIALELMEFTGGPLNQKVIGFFVHCNAPGPFSPRELAATLNDRARFQPLIDGFVTLQAQIPDLRALTQEWLGELIAPAAQSETETIVAAANEPQAEAAPQAEIEAPVETEVAAVAASDGEAQSAEVENAEPEVAAAEPTPESLDLAARGAEVPPYVGVVPETLLPIALQIVDPKTDAPFDYALDDAGLEESAAAFVHDPMWEDIGEEIEVALLPEADKTPTETKIVMLNHHIRSGTVKIRGVDRAFFGMTEPFVQFKFHDPEDDETLEVWAARAIGIVYEMGQWFDENLPPSGGTIKFERSDKGIEISVDRPNAETFLTPRRLHELEDLRRPAAKMSLFELLSRLVEDHPAGMTLPALWAEVNVVRRTSKRLMTSVLSSYGVFSCKEGRNKEMVWLYDKNGGGFREEKRAFVRR